MKVSDKCDWKNRTDIHVKSISTTLRYVTNTWSVSMRYCWWFYHNVTEYICKDICYVKILMIKTYFKPGQSLLKVNIRHELGRKAKGEAKMRREVERWSSTRWYI